MIRTKTFLEKFKDDPRYIVFLILFTYLVLGFTVLGFNRNPWQALLTSLTAVVLELFYGRVFKKKWVSTFSALITSCSLSLLLNYSHGYFIVLIPVFFAISSKYLLTFNGRHFYNPAQTAVTLCLLFFPGMINLAPAYQWNGIANLYIFMIIAAVIGFMPKIKRTALVFSFLLFFTLQTALRAFIMRHHLPFETLFLGTITSPAFILFAFFMITDPATSPSSTRDQIKAGFWIAFIDLLFHTRQSYYTFFYAGFVYSSYRFLMAHLGNWKNKQFVFLERKKIVVVSLIAALLFVPYILSDLNPLTRKEMTFKMLEKNTEIKPSMAKTLERLDPRVHHMAKWMISVGDSVAVGDVDLDGDQDLFFTFPLKSDDDRNSLFLNEGEFSFKRHRIESIEQITKNIESFGLPSNALFVDYDNDHDLDLFITYAFGQSRMLKNHLKEEGRLRFSDESESLGLDTFSNSTSATFFDSNGDGKLDLLVGNVWPDNLPDYDEPKKLNLFKLPKAEYEGDTRMYNFMHSSWHMSDNGGVNDFYIMGDNRYEKVPPGESELSETYWSLAIGVHDFNQDGKLDLYIANDFGPDNFYYGRKDNSFRKHEGLMFGDIGKDTYKGMNVSIADFDRNGWQDIYISNVHHALQAEGSLLWAFFPNQNEYPKIEDKATEWGALNVKRFGWGASARDFNNDGWVDIAQANGMVDDSIDKKYETCPDYWYVNEKIARSAPEVHRHIHNWGDIRGYCIFGKEKNRLLLNHLGTKNQKFIDIADWVGMDKETNSRGMAAVDLNNDGNLDLVVTHQFSAPTIYENKPLNSKSRNEWIGLELSSFAPACPSLPIGSTIELTYKNEQGKEEKQVKIQEIVSGFAAQNDTRIHFGLGKNSSQLKAKIKWCGKWEKEYLELKKNTYHKIKFAKEDIWKKVKPDFSQN